MMAETYETLLVQLAQHREIFAEATAAQGRAIKAVTDTPEFQAAADLQSIARERILAVEIEVRTKALREFNATGDKRPHPAIGIRVMTKLQYGLADALEFAKAHIPAALKLDAREFEKAARVLKPAFVIEASEPQATIATDLSEYLPKAGK